jgi:hypothetical protein
MKHAWAFLSGCLLLAPLLAPLVLLIVGERRIWICSF